MDQPTFADLEFQGKKRKTRRELFLERMESLIPWQQLEERIRPFYPQCRKGPPPLSAGGDAAESMCATLLQPQRPRYGGPAV